PAVTQISALSLHDALPISFSGSILRSEALQDHNTFEEPEKIKPADYGSMKVRGGRAKVELPPFSVVVLKSELKLYLTMEMHESLKYNTGLKGALLFLCLLCAFSCSNDDGPLGPKEVIGPEPTPVLPE